MRRFAPLLAIAALVIFAILSLATPRGGGVHIVKSRSTHRAPTTAATPA